MSSIQPRALIEVGPDFAEELGLDWKKDRQEVVKKINEFREMLFLDPTMPRLFTDRFYCCKVQCFVEPCLTPCGCDYTVEPECGKSYPKTNQAHYYGVTLPTDIDGVLHVFADKQPLKGYSKWWEGREHRATKDCGPTLSWMEMHESFPTETQMTEPAYLSVFAEHPEDCGKCMSVTVKTGDKDKTEEIIFVLEGNAVVKSEKLTYEIVSVVLPPDLIGCVTLAAGENELSTYPPHITVPCYQRIKINTPCETDQVLVHGNQKFEPICFDSDIVEVGSRLLLKHAARYFRYADGGTESDEIARARIEENKFKSLIKGAVERKRGNAKQDPSIFVRKPIHRNTSLYGRKRRRS